jgi:aminoglycoside 3-N-acetyltransferase
MTTMMDRVRASVRSMTDDTQRARLKAVRSVFRQWRAALTPATTRASLARDLRRAGIHAGDAVMVHSSLSSLKNVDGGAEAVIAALQDAVSPGGTILMPAYGVAEEAFERSRTGEYVALRTMGTQNGKITQVFARMPGVLRSSHPFSSVCAWGEKASWLLDGHALDHRMAHRDSPLGRLLQIGGKVLGIGVSMGPVSFYHVVEDTTDDFPLDVYAPSENVTYIDAAGVTVTRPIGRYDRNVTRARIDNDHGLAIRDFMTRHLRARGARRDFKLGQAPAFWIGARAFYDEVRALAARGLTIYATEEQVHAFERTAQPSNRARVRSRAQSRGNAGLRP